MQRIAVVGAGISGLSHAYYLKKRFPGAHVALFNGQKPGGNIATEQYEGATLEPGLIHISTAVVSLTNLSLNWI
jgi:oxygen-dependent protoporphyrinogen oxidase